MARELSRPSTLTANYLNEQLKGAKFKGTLDVEDFDAFQGRLHYLYKSYSSLLLPRLVENHLAPHFDHVRSFEKAITVSMQQNMVSSGVWTGALAVIECTCRFQDYMEETFEQLGQFYTAFPRFEQYITMFPGNTYLQLIIQDLYKIYTEFCVQTIKFISEPAVVHIVKNLFSSKLSKKLSSIVKKWKALAEEFDKHTALAFRRQVMGQSSTATRTSPRTSNMPRKHDFFVGRKEVLKEMYQALLLDQWQPGSPPRECLIHAMGGMGKTQTALAYNYENENEYDFRLWVKADDPTTLTNSIDSICRLLDLDHKVTGVEALKNWLEMTDKSWLLIFDNVEHDTAKELHSLWPSKAQKQSAIILTSQVSALRQAERQTISLPSLTSEDSAELLSKYLRRNTAKVSNDEDEVFYEVVRMLGGLPLAIKHIGGYIGGSRHNLSYFRDFFNQRWQKEAWTNETLVDQGEKTLNIVFDVALEKLPPNARKLIDIMAYLHPDAIPEDWLIEDIATDEDWGHFRDSSQESLLDMVFSLTQRNLIDYDDESDWGKPVYSIHRSLQLALQIHLDKNPETRRNVFRHALAIVTRASPRAPKSQIPDSKTWEGFQRSNPHALSLCRAYTKSEPGPRRPFDLGTIQLAELLYHAGFHVWQRWNPITADGLLLLKTAESILDRLQYDPHGRLRADISCIQGLLLDREGLSQRERCLQKRVQTKKIREFILEKSGDSGPSYRDNELLFYNSLNDLGLSYLQNDDFIEAEKIFDSCLKKYNEWGTEFSHSYEYAKYYHNMGHVRMYQGKYSEAISLSEKGAAIKKREDGLDNPRYWWFQYDVACIMLQAGKLDSALERHKEVLDNRIRVCGERQEVTLQSLYAVGAMYYHLADYPNAEKFFRQCLDFARTTRWQKGDRGRTKYHLALSLEKQGKAPSEVTREKKEARRILAEIYNGCAQRPQYLLDVDDDMVLFDWTQPSFEGRWTGQGLLRRIQRHAVDNYKS